MDKIGKLWKDSSAAIEQALKNGRKAACIYHGYQSDYRGEYLASLCVEDEKEGEFDTSLHQWKDYPAGGKDPEHIISTWKKIWEVEDQGSIAREYSFDMEEYSPDGTVRIRIALK